MTATAKAYTLEPHGDGWLLVGPACPREDGYYRVGLAAAQAECRLLNEVHAAAVEQERDRVAK